MEDNTMERLTFYSPDSITPPINPGKPEGTSSTPETERTPISAWMESVKSDIQRGEAVAFVHSRVDFDIEEDTVKKTRYEGYQNTMLRGRSFNDDDADKIRNLMAGIVNVDYSSRGDNRVGFPREEDRSNETLYVSIAKVEDLPESKTKGLPDVVTPDKAVIELRYKQPGADKYSRLAEKSILMVVSKEASDEFQQIISAGVNPDQVRESAKKVFVGETASDLFDANLVNTRDPQNPVVEKAADKPHLEKIALQVTTGNGGPREIFARKQIIEPSGDRTRPQVITEPLQSQNEEPDIFISGQQSGPENKKTPHSEGQGGGSDIPPTTTVTSDEEPDSKGKSAAEWYRRHAENPSEKQTREYWVGNGNDIPDKRPYLREAGMSETEIDAFIKTLGEPETSTAGTSKADRTETKTNTSSSEKSGSMSYADLKFEYNKVLTQLLIDKGLSDTTREILKASKASIEAQMDTMERKAQDLGLLDDVNRKERDLRTTLLAYQADLLSPEDRERFEKQVASWNIGKGRSSAEFDGLREDYLARKRADIISEIKKEKVSDRTLLKQVRKLDEVPAKRLANIDSYKPEAQREAMRVVIEEIEAQDISPRESANNAVRGAIEAVLPRLDAEVQAEVRARLHLHACAMSLRKVNTAESDKVGYEFQRAVNEIGEYSLTGTDFETLLQRGLPGLKVREAFNVLQDAAYTEKRFSGKKSETELEHIRQELVDRIYSLHNGDPTFDRKSAQTSYDLAMKIAEATYERSVWDTSAGDYMSQAIYFSKWRRERNKGPQVTIDHIESIGTSFFRTVSTAENKRVKIFHAGDWWDVTNTAEPLKVLNYKSKAEAQAHARETQNNLYRARFKALQLQRIQSTDPKDIADFFEGDVNAARAFVADNVIQDEKLDFMAANFRAMSGTAYRDYLTQTVKEILDAKDLLIKTDIGAQDLRNDNMLLKWAETLDKVDPTGVMSLRFYFIAGAMDVALNTGMEYSEADRIARNLHRDKRSGKGTFYYLGEYLATGEKTEEALKDMTQYFRRGMQNAVINNVEKIFGLRK